jgi:hypothetical protein
MDLSLVGVVCCQSSERRADRTERDSQYVCHCYQLQQSPSTSGRVGRDEVTLSVPMYQYGFVLPGRQQNALEVRHIDSITDAITCKEITHFIFSRMKKLY